MSSRSKANWRLPFGTVKPSFLISVNCWWSSVEQWFELYHNYSVVYRFCMDFVRFSCVNCVKHSRFRLFLLTLYIIQAWLLHCLPSFGGFCHLLNCFELSADEYKSITEVSLVLQIFLKYISGALFHFIVHCFSVLLFSTYCAKENKICDHFLRGKMGTSLWKKLKTEKIRIEEGKMPFLKEMTDLQELWLVLWISNKEARIGKRG